jgi:hypothetical protein
MKTVLLSFVSLAFVAGCATAPSAGLETGKFVRFACNGGKSFAARISDDGKSLRVRTHEGAVELDAAGDGQFKGDGFTFFSGGDKGIALQHKDKWVGESCKKEA